MTEQVARRVRQLSHARCLRPASAHAEGTALESLGEMHLQSHQHVSTLQVLDVRGGLDGDEEEEETSVRWSAQQHAIRVLHTGCVGGQQRAETWCC